MKTTFFQTLIVSGLFACAPVVAASEQGTVSGRDMAWMKEQQQALQAFKDGLQGQTLNLPQAQQDLIARLQNDMAGQPDGGNADRKSFPAIYFVSLGLPREGLLPMLQDATRYGIPATLRGLVNNDLRQTASAMYELSKTDNKVGVQIDPTLFSEYHITTVPALVVTCPGHFDVIRGSLPLQQALEKVAEQGDCAATARQLLERAK